MGQRDTWAFVTRLRQEMEKRIDANGWRRNWAARGSWIHSIAHALRPAAGEAASNNRLVEWLREQTVTEFPTAALVGRRPIPRMAEQIVREADEIYAGRYTVLGLEVNVLPDWMKWGAHPATGVLPALEPWHRVRYLDGLGGGDIKHLWELNRHGLLVRLGQAYWLTRDRRYAERALELWDGWTDQSPPGWGVNWASSLEVGFRAVSWCWLWAFTRDSAAWTDSRVERFLTMMWNHADHVDRYDSSHYSPNTHLTGEAVALLYVSCAFPFLRRSGRWWSRGVSILERARRKQLLDDGMHYERSVGYHRYTLEFYLHELLLRRARGLEAGSERVDAVRRMLMVSAAFRRPDGTWPVIGDDDGGVMLRLTMDPPEDQGPLLALGSRLLDAPEFGALTTERHHQLAWWTLGPDETSSARVRDRTVLPTTCPLRAAGYYLAREDWGATSWYYAVDAGPHGGDITGHAHTDLGHVEIAHGAIQLVNDPGCASYTIGKSQRDRARSEAVHASLVLRSSALAEPSGPFAWARVSPSPRVMTTVNNGVWSVMLEYERLPKELRHRRSVFLLREVGVVVVDSLLGTVPAGASIHWPLATDPKEISVIAGGVRFKGHDIVFATTSSARVTAGIEPLAISPSYGRLVAGASFSLGIREGTSITVATAFLTQDGKLSITDHGAEQLLTVASSSRSAALVIDDAGQMTWALRSHGPLTKELA